MSDLDIYKMLSQIKEIYLDSSNSLKKEFEAEIKILSIDLIKDSDYYNITEENIIPDKIYIKNQINNHSIYIVTKNLKSFKKNKKSLTFLTLDDNKIVFKL